MAYTALYRKYRPLTFDDVVGQHDVVETLKNKITTGKIGHAILLTGSRGTGKTTLAKIFARAINCLNPSGSNPCNVCDVCKGILSESLLDVIELDAASNNGVDDVRSINEKVKFPPSTAKYKVFIVDEVHMMSKAAFNAFLKTLEEPPGYILFIFATTDPQAIPNTVLSRCQRFDLKRVSHTDIHKRLEIVCELAGLECTSEGLELIVRRSDGAVRDALSILDKCSNFGNTIDKDTVVAAIGLVDDEIMVELSKAILGRNIEKALLLVNDVVNSGRNETYFLGDLQDHFRNLLMVMAGENLAKLIMRSEAYLNELDQIKKNANFSRVVSVIERLGDDVNKLKRSENTRITLETCIARLCIPQMENDYDGFVERLEKLEKSGVVIISETSTGKPELKTQLDPPPVLIEEIDETVENAQIEEEAQDTPELEISEVDFDLIVDQWDRIISTTGKFSKLTSNFISDTKPVELDGKVISVMFRAKDENFYENMKQSNRSADLEGAILEVLGLGFKVEFVLEEKKDEDFSEDDILSFFKGFEDKLTIT